MPSLFNSTTDGWPYIGGNQNASLIDDYALELATKLDAVVPFAMAAGSGTITITAATSGSVTLTYPTGRFSVAPIVTVANLGGSGSSQVYLGVTANSASSVTITAYQRDNATVTATITVHYHAVQMNTGAANG